MSKRNRGSGTVCVVTEWYVEPIGDFTNDSVARLSDDSDWLYDFVCADGEPHNLVNKSDRAIKALKQSRLRDSRYRFAIWYKDPETGEIVLSEGDSANIHHQHRTARRSLVTGKGKPTKFPRKRKPRGGLMNHSGRL